MSDQSQVGRSLAALVNLGQIGTSLQQDVDAFSAEVSRQVELFENGDLDLETICYWHQALASAFLTFADGTCFAVREAITANATACGIELSAKTQHALAPESRTPLEKLAPLAFRTLARLFGADFAVDTSGEAFRGFKALTDAREAFAHPKDHTEVCPFSLFPTLTSSAEWFIIQWRALLVACTRALGHPLHGDAAPVPRFRYRDERLVIFATARADWDEGRAIGDFSADLADVVLPLRRNTVRALEVYNAQNIIADIPVACRLRNLIRFLFTEVEGCVLIAFALIGRSDPTQTPNFRNLLTGPHDEVRSRVADTLDELAQRFTSAGPIDRTGPGWEAFVPLRELRNKLTHPHAAQDLLVGSDSLDITLAFADWWHLEVHPRLDQAILEHAKR